MPTTINGEIELLSPEDEAIFNVIVELRKRNINAANVDGGNVFKYKESTAQLLLNRNGAAVKYGIGSEKQHEIVKSLAERGIINADWTIPTEDGDSVLVHDSEWARELLVLDKVSYIGGVCPECIYINIGFDEIKAINDNLIKQYTSTLSFDESKMRFVVKSDNGKKYEIKRITRGSLPYEVFRIAVQHAGDIILRDDINKGLYNHPNSKAIRVGDKSIATQVFDDGCIVRNELSPFVEKMTSESIRVFPGGVAELTQVQLDAIDRASH